MYTLYSVVFLLLINITFGSTNSKEVKTILDDPKCSYVKLLCGNISEKDDLLILECLQSIHPKKLNNIGEECEHVVWNHTNAIIKNDRVKNYLLPTCMDDLSKLNCEIDSNDGTYLKCIVNNREDITNEDCRQMILRLENVAFSDFRWIQDFLKNCNDDITKLSCGRIDAKGSSQLQTVACLQTNILNIDDECKKEVFKLSELQSDSIRLDSQLYLECAEDHMRYCKQFYAGSGRVFSCLMQQDQNNLNEKCRQHLQRRQKLIAQDYRVSKGLMRACRDDIKKTHCRRQTSNDKNIRLSQILLCLENIAKNGTKLQSDCMAEMIEHRKVLMEDYRLSPEIVDNCKNEISTFCQGIGIGGKTIHCLMNHAIPKNGRNNVNKMGDTCRRALEALVKQTDAGEDWRVDPVLHQACYPVVKSICKGISGGNARVMSCLMDSIGADQMTDECEDALMQIQYFVARDFKLDPQLYKACKEDAALRCHETKEWDNPDAVGIVEFGPQVLPCLYRYADHSDQQMQLNKTCLQQIRRVMRQRAISVDLQPEIEDACLSDLSIYCNDKVKKGEEMMCLQKNLDDLQPKCQEVVESFTEIEGEHAELNPYIMKYCRDIMETLCNPQTKHDEGDLMECLIQHKNDPMVKSNQNCRASIEHFQIISVKDYRFTYKFKVACKSHAMRLCGNARTKTDVVVCLSEHLLNDTIHGIKSSIRKDCKQQLKAQLFQQRENIDYDPKLKEACSQDIKKFCGDIQPGNAQVLECLQSQHKQLTEKCGNELFKVKKQEIYDNSVDYALMTICADSIQQYCPNHDKETVLDCLKLNKDKRNFGEKCRLIVLHRMVEQNSNYQLNPSLQQNCQMDITKYCSKALKDTHNNHNNKDVNGPIIKCLKDYFKASKLSNKCEKEMANILREQALDINLNPLIRAVCKDELNTICSENDENSVMVGGGDAEECLKDAFLKKRIPTPECNNEIANIIQESQADIQVDPLLQRACALDLLNLCQNVPQGNGRQIQCLKIILDNTPDKLNANCKQMLKKRFEMYKKVKQDPPPQDFNELYQQVVASPAKHYFFFMILTIFGAFFVIGVFCGRVSKKHRLLKNK